MKSNSAQFFSANDALTSGLQRQPLCFYGWCTGLCSTTLKKTATSRIREQIATVKARGWTLETAPSSSAYLASRDEIHAAPQTGVSTCVQMLTHDR